MKYDVTASNGFDALMLFLVHLTVRDLFLTEDLGRPEQGGGAALISQGFVHE